MNTMRPQCVGISGFARCFGIAFWKYRVTRLSHQRVIGNRSLRIRRGIQTPPEWTHALKISVLKKPLGSNARWKGVLGVAVSVAIAAAAIFALTHALKNVNYTEVLETVRHTKAGIVALALMLVATSYATLTLYDWLALRTIGRPDVPYRIAALASFTSYPIAHGIGAVALVSPVIRFRIYSSNGLGAIDVANICFLTGLTFWLGNLTALGISLLNEPDAVSLIDYLPPPVNRLIAIALLLGVVTFMVWSWLNPRCIGLWRWPVRLPSGPMVLLQIAIGIIDLGAAALAMYVLFPAGVNIGISRITAVFIVATMLGFASHTPAGIGVFDAAILIGLGGDDREPVIAALLMFRLLYHFVPFVLALCLFGCVEAWRSLRAQRPLAGPALHRRIELETDHPGDDQGKAENSNGIGRLAVDQYSDEDAAGRADPGPYGIGRAERKRLECDSH
jgi:glycosyltransferase 2 family protein